MGIGIFGTLHISKEALFTQQSAVSVTSHNIANVNTPGYSRQSPIIQPIDPQQVAGLYFGRGAQLTGITKNYDKFLNNSIMLEKSVLGKWDVQETYMGQAESVFNESSDLGLNAIMNDFWDAWQDLADHPEGIAERAIVQSQGDRIAKTFQSMRENLDTIREDANNRIADVVDRIGILAEEIASLNAQILVSESSQTSPNDLTDQRTLKSEQLAELIDITVIQEGDGQVTILTGTTGKQLVSENLSWELDVDIDPNRDNLLAVEHSDGETKVDITDRINGGSLKGLIEIRDEIIPAYIDKLDMLAATLVNEVNALHYSGYGLDGSTGNYYFNPLTILAEADTGNRGGGTLYDVEISDPSAVKTSDYEIEFLDDYPQTAVYTLYDSINGEYVYRIDAGNSTIVFNDSGTNNIISTAELTQGTYSGDELADELQKQLESASFCGQEYAVTYDEETREFSINNHGSQAVDIRWNDSNTTAAEVLGFDDRFIIKNGINDQISFDDGTGGAAESARLRTGSFTADAMAAEIERALEAGGAATFSVTYDSLNRIFTIQVDSEAGGGVDFNWTGSTAAETLGFNADASGLAATNTDSSDYAPGTLIVPNGSASSTTEAGVYSYAANIFEIDATNNGIVINDGAGPNTTATLQNGIYTAEEMSSEIERALEAAGGAAFSVEYDNYGKFVISADSADGGPPNTVDILWSNAASTAAGVLGFDATDTIGLDPSDASSNSDTSDTAAGTYRYFERIFKIDPDINDTIVFDDGGIGDGTGGTWVTATIAAGDYTGQELAAEIERLLEGAQGAAGQDYIVQYDVQQGYFNIINNSGNRNSVSINWNSATSLAAQTLGYSAGTATVSVGSSDSSDSRVGDVMQYRQIDFYGMTSKLADEDGRPVTGDIFHIMGVTGAAQQIAMDPITLTDTEKLAAALSMFDITGDNNVLVFDNDGDLTDGTNYRVELESGRYSASELAKAIEKQLEENGADYFTIQNGVNDQIIFDDGSGGPFTATIAAGTYTGDELAAALDTALDTAPGSGATFSVSYDADADRFAIQVDGAALPANAVTLNWSVSNAASTLGFQSADSLAITAADSDTSDFSVRPSYTVTYDETLQEFSITSNTGNVQDLVLLWEHDETTAESMLGFDEKLFLVEEGVNDRIVFNEDGGSNSTIAITANRYTGEELAREIQEQLRAAGSEEYVVSYDETSRSFSFSNPAEIVTTLNVLWSDAATTIEADMGFDAVDDAVTAAAAAVSDYTPGRIAAGTSLSSDFATGGPAVGDNRNALDIAALKDAAIIAKDTQTLDDYYSVLVGSVGTDMSNTTSNIEFQEFMIEQFEERRQSIAGVSIDEEMINLIRYQQAYAAATKLVSTLDTMLDQLLSLK